MRVPPALLVRLVPLVLLELRVLSAQLVLPVPPELWVLPARLALLVLLVRLVPLAQLGLWVLRGQLALSAQLALRGWSARRDLRDPPDLRELPAQALTHSGPPARQICSFARISTAVPTIT